MVSQVRSVLSQYDWSENRFFFTPNIPAKKLNNALASYAPQVKADEVLLLLDDTMFGGSREGLLISERGVAAKELGQPIRQITWDKVTQIGVAKKAKLVINGEVFFKACIIEHLSLLTLVARLKKALGLIDEAPVQRKAMTSGSLRTSQNQPTSKKVPDYYGLKAHHPIAMASLGDDVGTEYLKRINLNGLISEISDYIDDLNPTLREAARKLSTANKNASSVDKDQTAIALVLLVFSYVDGLSSLPKNFWGDDDDLYFQINGLILLYVDKFKKTYRDKTGITIDLDDDFFGLISGIACSLAGRGGMEVHQAKMIQQKMLESFGLLEPTVIRLQQRSRQSAQRWFKQVILTFATT